MDPPSPLERRFFANVVQCSSYSPAAPRSRQSSAGRPDQARGDDEGAVVRVVADPLAPVLALLGDHREPRTGDRRPVGVGVEHDDAVQRPAQPLAEGGGRGRLVGLDAHPLGVEVLGGDGLLRRPGGLGRVVDGSAAVARGPVHAAAGRDGQDAETGPDDLAPPVLAGLLGTSGRGALLVRRVHHCASPPLPLGRSSAPCGTVCRPACPEPRHRRPHRPPAMRAPDRCRHDCR